MKSPSEYLSLAKEKLLGYDLKPVTTFEKQLQEAALIALTNQAEDAEKEKTNIEDFWKRSIENQYSKVTQLEVELSQVKEQRQNCRDYIMGVEPDEVLISRCLTELGYNPDGH